VKPVCRIHPVAEVRLRPCLRFSGERHRGL
jgi:hypothetical protein